MPEGENWLSHKKGRNYSLRLPRNSYKLSFLSFKYSSKPFITKTNELDDQLLIQKLSNGGQKNICKWFEKIVDVFYKEKEIKEQTSFDEMKSIFHDDFA